MAKKKFLINVTTLSIAIIVLAGCASTPKKTVENSSVIFSQSLEKTRKVAPMP